MSKECEGSYTSGFVELANPLQWPQLRKRRRFLPLAVLLLMTLLPFQERLLLSLFFKTGLISLHRHSHQKPLSSSLLILSPLPLLILLKVHSFCFFNLICLVMLFYGCVCLGVIGFEDYTRKGLTFYFFLLFS